MFKLHDKTRRVLTLLIFLVFGPALLTLVLTWVVLHRSSFTRAGWEQTLSRVTGKHVEIEKIEFPMPGVVRFLQCRIIEQETGATLVYIPQMELIDVIGEIPVAEIQDNKPFQRSFGESVHYLFSMLRNEKKRYRHCDIPSLSCFETAIAGAKSAIGRLITQTAAIKSSIRGGEPFDTDVKPFVLQIGQLDLFFADGNAADSQAVWENGIASTNGGTKKRETSRSGSLDYTTIKNLKSVFRPDRDLSMLTASFQIADPLAGETSDAGKPVQFEMTRERQTTLRMTTRFSSPETVVSLSLLSRFAPFFKGFGDNCYFQGNAIFRTVDGVLPQREQTLELRNASFFNVSLESFLEKHLPFAVSGNLERLDITSALLTPGQDGVSAGKLVRVEGVVQNGQGSVDWPGLSRLALGTQMQILPQNVQPLQNHVTFRQCRFGFAIDASGIRLIPMTASQSYLQQQTLPLLVIDNQCGIYWPSPGHYIRHAEFLAALARPTSTLVPLTPETERLMTFLPSQPTLREFNRTPNVLNRTTAIAAPATNAGK